MPDQKIKWELKLPQKRFFSAPPHLVALALLLSLFYQNCSKVAVQDQVVYLSSLSAFATNEDTPVRLRIPLAQPNSKILLNGIAGTVSAPTAHGVIENFDEATGKFDYIPHPNFNGQDSVSALIVLTDGRQIDSNHSIEVIPVNDKPEAQDVYIESKIGEKRIVSLADFKAADVDQEPLQLELLDKDNNPVGDFKEGTWGRIQKVVSNGQNKFEFSAYSLGATSHRFRIRDASKAEVVVTATFSPENPVLAFKPALVVRNLNCIFCHATIKGNVISDYTSAADISVGFRGVSTTSRSGDYTYSHWGDHGARSFLLTVFLDGTFYLPTKKIEGPSLTKGLEILAESKGTSMDSLNLFGKKGNGTPLSGFSLIDPSAKVLKATAPSAVSFISEWVDTTLNFRTEAFIEQMRIFPSYLMPANATINSPVKEVASVKIGAPSESEIKALLRDGESVTYYKQGDDARDLTHFKSHGSYFGNEVDQVMNCDGDLVVDGPVYFKNLKLKTKYGCRIYATGTVFIESHRSTDTNTSSTELNRPGIEYVDITEKTQLQIVSARAIMMGLGKCTSTPEQGTVPEEGQFGRRIQYDNQGFAPIGGVVKEDYYKIKAPGASSILQTDAGDCASKTDRRRSVGFERMLLNAPRIDSRYTGDFKGVIIALDSIWSLGKFSYQYDPVFDQVPILPLISSEKFFSIQDCENDGSRMLVAKTETLKICVTKP